MEVQVLLSAPNHENPNLFLIGEGFGFFVFATRLKEQQLLHDMGLQLEDPERQYCTAMLNAMLLSAVKVWIENGGKESVEELYEILKSNIALIRKYL